MNRIVTGICLICSRGQRRGITCCRMMLPVIRMARPKPRLPEERLPEQNL